MTQDEIIEMAREAGFMMENSAAIQAAEIFAHLVAAKKREACALICDDHHEIWRFGEGEYSASGPKDCAAAIRVRGEAQG
jgi:hypothetical protein